MSPRVEDPNDTSSLLESHHSSSGSTFIGPVGEPVRDRGHTQDKTSVSGSFSSVGPLSYFVCTTHTSRPLRQGTCTRSGTVTTYWSVVGSYRDSCIHRRDSETSQGREVWVSFSTRVYVLSLLLSYSTVDSGHVDYCQTFFLLVRETVDGWLKSSMKMGGSFNVDENRS